MRVIDLFAGAGGFSTAATMAGCDVLWAANHWQSAVDTHAANYPLTRHVCQDLQQARWADVPSHDLLLASWCCQGHSRARGKAPNNPEHDDSRATAWAVIDALEYHRPDAFVGENVVEFLEWVLFEAWRLAVEALGYSLSIYTVDAADHGVPQHRVRVFIVGTRSKNPIVLKLPKQPHVPASSFIDFDGGKWSWLKDKVPNTQRRAANGRAAGFGDRFIMPYYGKGSGLTGRSVARPIGTITTRDRWALVRGDQMRMLSANECRAAMGFPEDYTLPAQHRLAVHMLGNAVCPPAARDVILALKAAA